MSKKWKNPRQEPSASDEGIARSQPNLPQKIKRLDSSTSSHIGRNNNENGTFLRRTQSQNETSLLSHLVYIIIFKGELRELAPKKSKKPMPCCFQLKARAL